MQVVNVAKNKITSIKAEFGKEVPLMAVCQALVGGFQKALKTQLISGELTSYEQELAERLFREKYATDKWNFQVEPSAKNKDCWESAC